MASSRMAGPPPGALSTNNPAKPGGGREARGGGGEGRPRLGALSPREWKVGRTFFFNDTGPTEIYPLPLDAALPVSRQSLGSGGISRPRAATKREVSPLGGWARAGGSKTG